MNHRQNPLFEVWPYNHTLQKNVYGLPSLEYMQRHITGSVLEKSKTKVLNILLNLKDFMKSDLRNEKNFKPPKLFKLKSVKIMLFKNKEKGHQLKVIGVSSRSKVEYCFRIIHSMFCKIPHHKNKKFTLKYNIKYGETKVTNIVFGWFLPRNVVKTCFNHFWDISENLKTSCTHRPQKFPQLCIKKTKPLDKYDFSCTISHKGYCIVAGQKNKDKIGEIQQIILNDFINMKNNNNGDLSLYVNDDVIQEEEFEGEDGEEEEEERNSDELSKKIRNNKLQLLNIMNYSYVSGGDGGGGNKGKRGEKTKKFLFISKLDPPSQKYIEKTNALYPFGRNDSELNFHQKLQKKLYLTENLNIKFDEILLD